MQTAACRGSTSHQVLSSVLGGYGAQTRRDAPTDKDNSGPGFDTQRRMLSGTDMVMNHRRGAINDANDTPMMIAGGRRTN